MSCLKVNTVTGFCVVSGRLYSIKPGDDGYLTAIDLSRPQFIPSDHFNLGLYGSHNARYNGTELINLEVPLARKAVAINGIRISWLLVISMTITNEVNGDCNIPEK